MISSDSCAHSLTINETRRSKIKWSHRRKDAELPMMISYFESRELSDNEKTAKKVVYDITDFELISRAFLTHLVVSAWLYNSIGNNLDTLWR